MCILQYCAAQVKVAARGVRPRDAYFVFQNVEQSIGRPADVDLDTSPPGTHPARPAGAAPRSREAYLPQTVIRITPAAARTYGLLGLIPFIAPPAVGLILPPLAGLSTAMLAIYGALILSFLGGARWGFAYAHPGASAWLITLTMLPTLAGFALLLLPSPLRALQLAGLAAALAIHGLWDMRGRGLPPWYPRLRVLLSLGAVTGLGLGIRISLR
jgi:hypothetical protein